MKMLALSIKIVNEAFVGKVANRDDKVEIIFCFTDKYTDVWTLEIRKFSAFSWLCFDSFGGKITQPKMMTYATFLVATKSIFGKQLKKYHTRNEVLLRSLDYKFKRVSKPRLM